MSKDFIIVFVCVLAEIQLQQWILNSFLTYIIKANKGTLCDHLHDAHWTESRAECPVLLGNAFGSIYGWEHSCMTWKLNFKNPSPEAVSILN